MVEFDWATGEILDTLEEHGLTKNTIVIFSSDNGPVYDDGYDDGTKVHTSSKEVDQGHDGSGPYRGGKYQIYEGGTRVPFIIRWPAKIAPGTSKALVNQIDFVASFARLTGQDLPADEAVDSRDTLDAFLGKDAKGLPYMIEEARTLALRKGDWKFIRGAKNKKRAPAKGQLYNLAKDIGEQQNVIEQHPELAKELNTQLQGLVDKGRVRD
jgi:arylsulfatase A